MTHEFKHKVDLSRLDAPFSSCELPDAHEFMRMGCGAEMAFVFRSAPDILAYARELEARNKQLDAALRRIMDHGMPSESDTTQTWLRCSMSVYRIARDALEHGGTHEEVCKVQ